MRLAFLATVVGDSADVFGELRIGRKHGTAVAVAAEWLGWEKASAGHGANGAALTPVLLGTEALRGVFDDL